ncbi:MAG: His-Xaa-Ser system protein HxsD [Ewingella americana]|jgi:His-Xaa-Ser system protein HxsD|uniref:His-Xaa-Ser system protein HxsD n=1 Tax=Ewingella americana TaxID=41202 RepID=UPI00242C0FD0|nr:His-Xaa-Ser system protein HxsD [Ewingella americana]MCI1677606.1 His-Xaa-Ser system protein HxsD [Ewingella americana]MCI1852705.1 His-Xaa-Ser system protein HxsD [Ewingella americana]MCI1861209.1 His-Xaa-Ser system protein HxsD [Ewingella americana]MCI2143974.1 His-Xaa-Ser system protein HxsD [Ewingella americana]MCI2162728.1 His-Xaa-Ser system protein HxsD [Ewingella americana]
MWNKTVEKAKKSEWVIRNSLYWMTTYTRWKLDEDETNWYIYFDSFSEEIQFEFERLVNDFQLRESLQMQTGKIRNSIINNVLKSIDERLTQ